MLIASADNTFLDLHNFSDDTQPHSIIAKYSSNDLCRQFQFLFPLHLLVCPLLSYYIKLPTRLAGLRDCLICHLNKAKKQNVSQNKTQ